jgi:hypothetical protein
MQPASTAPVVSINLQTFGSWVLLIGFSTGAIILFAFLLMRGFWAQFIEPKLRVLFMDWYNNFEVKKERDKDIEQVAAKYFNSDEHAEHTKRTIAVWYNQQATRDEREIFTKKVIDDQIQRADGVIRKEINVHVDKLTDKIEGLTADVNSKFDTLNTSTNQMLAKLSRIEGFLSMPNKFDTGGQKPPGTKP